MLETKRVVSNSGRPLYQIMTNIWFSLTDFWYSLASSQTILLKRIMKTKRRIATTDGRVPVMIGFFFLHHIDIVQCADNIDPSTILDSKTGSGVGNTTVIMEHVSQEHFDKLVDDYTLAVIIVVQYCIISTLINIFGITTNIINIIVFIKQGFAESINISLFALAIVDLLSLILLQWANICFSPFLQYADVPFVSLEIQYLTAGWPRMGILRITAWITAFIAFERCICVTMPLKVKMIITPKRTVVVIITIFIVVLTSISPTYYTSRLVWKFFPQRNKTLLGLGFTEDRQPIDSVMFGLNNVFLPILAFSTVAVCTTILVVKLNNKSKWREKATSKGQQVSVKEKKLVKMVSVISTIFIFCFFPNAIIFLAMACVPEFNIDGKYSNLFIVTFDYCFLLESINSSVNIFLYLKLSSKFREQFNTVFGRCSLRTDKTVQKP